MQYLTSDRHRHRVTATDAMYHTTLLQRAALLVRVSALAGRHSLRPLATAATTSSSHAASEQPAEKLVGAVPHELLTSVPVHPTLAYVRPCLSARSFALASRRAESALNHTRVMCAGDSRPRL